MNPHILIGLLVASFTAIFFREETTGMVVYCGNEVSPVFTNLFPTNIYMLNDFLGLQDTADTSSISIDFPAPTPTTSSPVEIMPTISPTIMSTIRLTKFSSVERVNATASWDFIPFTTSAEASYPQTAYLSADETSTVFFNGSSTLKVASRESEHGFARSAAFYQLPTSVKSYVQAHMASTMLFPGAAADTELYCQTESWTATQYVACMPEWLRDHLPPFLTFEFWKTLIIMAPPFVLEAFLQAWKILSWLAEENGVVPKQGNVDAECLWFRRNIKCLTLVNLFRIARWLLIISLPEICSALSDYNWHEGVSKLCHLRQQTSTQIGIVLFFVATLIYGGYCTTKDRQTMSERERQESIGTAIDSFLTEDVDVAKRDAICESIRGINHSYQQRNGSSLLRIVSSMVHRSHWLNVVFEHVTGPLQKFIQSDAYVVFAKACYHSVIESVGSFILQVSYGSIRTLFLGILTGFLATLRVVIVPFCFTAIYLPVSIIRNWLDEKLNAFGQSSGETTCPQVWRNKFWSPNTPQHLLTEYDEHHRLNKTVTVKKIMFDGMENQAKENQKLKTKLSIVESKAANLKQQLENMAWKVSDQTRRVQQEKVKAERNGSDAIFYESCYTRKLTELDNLKANPKGAVSSELESLRARERQQARELEQRRREISVLRNAKASVEDEYQSHSNSTQERHQPDMINIEQRFKDAQAQLDAKAQELKDTQDRLAEKETAFNNSQQRVHIADQEILAKTARISTLEHNARQDKEASATKEALERRLKQEFDQRLAEALDNQKAEIEAQYQPYVKQLETQLGTQRIRQAQDDLSKRRMEYQTTYANHFNDGDLRMEDSVVPQVINTPQQVNAPAQPINDQEMPDSPPLSSAAPRSGWTFGNQPTPISVFRTAQIGVQPGPSKFGTRPSTGVQGFGGRGLSASQHAPPASNNLRQVFAPAKSSPQAQVPSSMDIDTTPAPPAAPRKAKPCMPAQPTAYVPNGPTYFPANPPPAASYATPGSASRCSGLQVDENGNYISPMFSPYQGGAAFNAATVPAVPTISPFLPPRTPTTPVYNTPFSNGMAPGARDSSQTDPLVQAMMNCVMKDRKDSVEEEDADSNMEENSVHNEEEEEEVPVQPQTETPTENGAAESDGDTVDDPDLERDSGDEADDEEEVPQMHNNQWAPRPASDTSRQTMEFTGDPSEAYQEVLQGEPTPEYLAALQEMINEEASPFLFVDTTPSNVVPAPNLPNTEDDQESGILGL